MGAWECRRTVLPDRKTHFGGLCFDLFLSKSDLKSGFWWARRSVAVLFSPKEKRALVVLASIKLYANQH